MDNSVFKQLTAGIKFDLKRFREDAERFEVIPRKSLKTEDCSVDDVGSEEAQQEGEVKDVEEDVRKTYHISVMGNDIPAPITSFSILAKRYGIKEKLLQNIISVGYNRPTAIQMQALPVMLDRRELTACAPTGSGKTAAFMIPIIHHLKEPNNGGFRALILSPTRELAHQTFREFLRLADGTGLRSHFIAKGAKRENEGSAGGGRGRAGSRKLRKCDVLVTTPNRLLFLLRQDKPAISLSKVEWLIIDESDKLFEEGKRGFRDQLGEIYRACDSPYLRRALFSATFATDVEQWCVETLDNVAQVYVGNKNATVEGVEQELVYVGCEAGKMVAMRDLVKKGLTPPVLVFMQSKERAREIFLELIYDGIYVSAIHSDMTQSQREKTVNAFRTGKIWVLICTDLLGRGIDFKGINLVINYDFPTSAISYIHRVGRTGRAGRKGRAITFFTDQDKPLLKSVVSLIRDAGCPVPEYLLSMKSPSKKKKHLPRAAHVQERVKKIPGQTQRLKAKNRANSRKTKKEKVDEKQKTENTTKMDRKNKKIVELKMDRKDKKIVELKMDRKDKKKIKLKMDRKNKKIVELKGNKNTGKNIKIKRLRKTKVFSVQSTS